MLHELFIHSVGIDVCCVVAFEKIYDSADERFSKYIIAKDKPIQASQR
jgi:phosphopantetheinyl transferase (holo-ACP synthase)